MPSAKIIDGLYIKQLEAAIKELSFKLETSRREVQRLQTAKLKVKAVYMLHPLRLGMGVLQIESINSTPDGVVIEVR